MLGKSVNMTDHDIDRALRAKGLKRRSMRMDYSGVEFDDVQQGIKSPRMTLI